MWDAVTVVSHSAYAAELLLDDVTPDADSSKDDSMTYSCNVHVCRAAQAAKVTFPESSGWRLHGLDLATINITHAYSSKIGTQAAPTDPDDITSGTVFIIQTQRVTR